MNEKILVVDDEQDILEALDGILTPQGFQVRRASSGIEAIEIFKSEPFDLVITDIRMPQMDGMEVLKQVKQLDESVEVIMLTSFATMENAIMALRDDGAFDYLTKPLEDIDNLLIPVNQALERRRLRLENKNLIKKLEKANAGLKLEIVERKRVQEALRESERRFRDMAELLPNIICETDLNLGLTYVNNLGLETFGFTQDEFDAGINVMDLVHPEDREKAAEQVAQGLKGIGVKSSEYRVLKKDGCEITGLLNGSPIYKDDQVTGIRISLTDITEQKNMQEEALKAKKLESLGLLAGGIAHDFNNLMTSVVGNISLARMEMKPESKAFRNLVEAEKASIRTKELTARLITFSEGGGPVKETVSIGDLVKGAVGSSLKSSDIDAGFSIPDDISPVEADEEQMKQVIHNVVTNAQEAMAGQGSINVSCENIDIGEKDTLTLKDGQYVKISIEDQGPGIPEEDLIRIFDPYFSTKEMGTQKGMGLGLAVSDSIVKKHDGLITVESELGRGTTLSIYLPAGSAESQAPGARRLEVDSQSTIVNRQSTIQRVLVMDDEEMVRNVTAAMLGHIGYEVELAVDGVEAIKMYKGAMESGKAYEAVILDLTNKIGMGGVETIGRLLKIDPDVKAIVATGYSSDPILSNFREHGFRGSLSKPFTLDELKTTLSEVVATE